MQAQRAPPVFLGRRGFCMQDRNCARISWQCEGKFEGVCGMKATMRSMMVLAAAISMAGAAGFAQSSGEAIYKANCQSCHGSSGTPSPGIAKMMGVKAASDPDIAKLTAAQEFDSIKNGKGKMKPFSGKLTDAQIKDVVSYFRTLK
jgi:cytochrome c6